MSDGGRKVSDGVIKVSYQVRKETDGVIKVLDLVSKCQALSKRCLMVSVSVRKVCDGV